LAHEPLPERLTIASSCAGRCAPHRANVRQASRRPAKPHRAGCPETGQGARELRAAPHKRQ